MTAPPQSLRALRFGGRDSGKLGIRRAGVSGRLFLCADAGKEWLNGGDSGYPASCEEFHLLGLFRVFETDADT
jgi:hypothetical protein